MHFHVQSLGDKWCCVNKLEACPSAGKLTGRGVDGFRQKACRAKWETRNWGRLEASIRTRLLQSKVNFGLLRAQKGVAARGQGGKERAGHFGDRYSVN
jgi:hypothetical protein